MIFLSLKFWPKVIFLERRHDFFGCENRTKGFFLRMLKKSGDFFG